MCSNLASRTNHQIQPVARDVRGAVPSRNGELDRRGVPAVGSVAGWEPLRPERAAEILREVEDNEEEREDHDEGLFDDESLGLEDDEDDHDDNQREDNAVAEDTGTLNNNNNDNNNSNNDEAELLMQADTDILEGTFSRQQQRLYGPDGIGRMDVTEEESGWIRAVKAGIEASTEVDNLATDFMYAQYALVERGNVAAAMDRAARMQAFREEYRVLDTYADACRHLQFLVDAMPGMFLSFSFNQSDFNYVAIIDVTKFDMSVIRTHETLSRCIKGWYYLLQALGPDLDGVRRGATFLCECQGYQWNKDHMIDFRTFERAWQELGMIYPGRFHQIKFFHTTVCFNLLASMSKRFLPKKIHDYFEIGCHFPYRLDTIYSLPSMAESKERVLVRLKETLQRRFQNEETFRLDTTVPIIRSPGPFPFLGNSTHRR